MNRTVRPRVMVSSVVTGFEEYRQAARRGIQAGGGGPLLVNEDFPALATSPRNACLDAVDSCDVFVIIIGERAGYTAPSGMPVVEEEYERAVKRGVPILAFVQEGIDREPAADRLANKVSDYVGGRFRQTFSSPDGLESAVQIAVGQATQHLEKPAMDPKLIESKLTEKDRFQREALLRTVFAPVRSEEVVDVVELGRQPFWEEVVSMGSKEGVGFFSQWESKDPELRGDSLIIEQNPGASRPVRYARGEITPAGIVSLTSNVTGREEDARALNSGFQIVESDVRHVLEQHFAFATAFFDKVDPYERQHAFNYNCALHGANHRPFVKEPSTGGTINMSMRGDQPVVAHEEPRQIGRGVLGQPASEVDRTLELMARRLRP